MTGNSSVERGKRADPGTENGRYANREMALKAHFKSRLPVYCLLVDELGYVNLRPEQTNIFFKLMEERYRRKPTIITSNLDYPEWQTFLGNKALVDALLSRLRHQCHTIRSDGPSLRDPQG
jgi:DNA replication protein DnaC